MSKPEYKSPWSQHTEAFKQAALRCRAIRDEIGGDVRDFQQESYELYEQWDQQELSNESGLASELYPRSDSVEAVIEQIGKPIIKRLVIINYQNFPAIQLDPRRAKAGSAQQLFPPQQPLPSDWFDGDIVVLQFHHTPSGVWYVARTGTSQTLLLQLWSDQDQPLGNPLRIGSTQARLPLELSALARIEVRLAGEHEP